LKTLAFVLALPLVLASTPVEASSITVTGVTTGCFGASCSGFGDLATSNGLTFDGGSFALEMFDTGAFALTGSFGTLARFSTSTLTTSFNLRLEFDNAFGVSPDPISYIAAVGYSGPGGNRDANFNFPPPNPSPGIVDFTYSNLLGSGTFSLAIRDLGGLRNGQTDLIAPAVSNTTFAPLPAPIPEPTSLVLLGTGLVWVGYRARGRKRERS
jgi:hypothetical protein